MVLLLTQLKLELKLHKLNQLTSQHQLSLSLLKTHGQKPVTLKKYTLLKLSQLKKVAILNQKKKNFHQPNTPQQLWPLVIIQLTLSLLTQLKLELKQLKLNQHMYQPQLSQLLLKTHGQKLVMPKN